MKSPSVINCITKFKRNIRSDIPLTIGILSQLSDLKAPDIEISLISNTFEFNPIYGKARFYMYGEHVQEVKFNCDLYPYYIINASNIDPEEHELDVKLYFENGYSTVWSNKLFLEIY